MLQQTTTNYMVPSSGSTHAVSDNPVLTAAGIPYDFRGFELDNYPFRPQGVFIDNSANTGEAVLTVKGMQFSVPVPAGASMAFNFPSPKGGAEILVTGNGQVNLTFVDFPVMPQLSYVAGQVVQMAAVPPGALAYAVQEVPRTVDPHYQSLTAAGAGAAITPAVAGTNLRKLKMSITGNASLAAAGLQNIQATLNGVLIFETNVLIPAAAGTGPVLWSDTLKFEMQAPNAGNGGLVMTLGTAFATGSMDVNAYFD